jgi:hypothetical protein
LSAFMAANEAGDVPEKVIRGSRFLKPW